MLLSKWILIYSFATDSLHLLSCNAARKYVALEYASREKCFRNNNVAIKIDLALLHCLVVGLPAVAIMNFWGSYEIH